MCNFLTHKARYIVNEAISGASREQNTSLGKYACTSTVFHS